MTRSLTRFAVLAVLALVVFPVFAQAPDGGVDPLLSDLTTVVQTANDAGHKGVAGVAAAIIAGLVLLTRLLVRFGKMLPAKVGAWFASPVATWVLPLVLSTLGALLTALTSGQPVDFGLIASAVFAGLAAGGFGSVPAKMEQLKKAEEAGVAASASVDTKAKAVAAMEKGPQP